MSNSKRDPFRDYGAFWRPCGGDPLGQMHLSRKTLATSMIEDKAIGSTVTPLAAEIAAVQRECRRVGAAEMTCDMLNDG